MGARARAEARGAAGSVAVAGGPDARAAVAFARDRDDTSWIGLLAGREALCGGADGCRDGGESRCWCGWGVSSTAQVSQKQSEKEGDEEKAERCVGERELPTARKRYGASTGQPHPAGLDELLS